MCVGAVMYCGGERRQSTHLRHIPRPSVVHARTAGIPMQQNKPVLNDFILSGFHGYMITTLTGIVSNNHFDSCTDQTPTTYVTTFVQ